MPRIPTTVAAASCYVDGARLPEVMDVDLPEIEFDTADVEAFGVAGTLQSVDPMRLGAMEVTFKPRGVSSNLARMLRIGQATDVDVRFVVNEASGFGTTRAVLCRAVVRCQPKGLKTSSPKPGNGDASEVKAAVSYYRLDVDGSTMIEADPANMVLTVDGEDLLLPYRLGL